MTKTNVQFSIVAPDVRNLSEPIELVFEHKTKVYFLSEAHRCGYSYAVDTDATKILHCQQWLREPGLCASHEAQRRERLLAEAAAAAAALSAEAEALRAKNYLLKSLKKSYPDLEESQIEELINLVRQGDPS